MHKTSVRPLAPWWLQRVIFSGKASQKAPESIVFGREDAGDVLPEDDALVIASSGANMVNCISDLHKFKGEVPALVGQRFAQAGHAECLAGGAATEHIGGRDFTGQHAPRDGGHVAQVGNAGVVVGQNSTREGFNLGQPCGLPSNRMPCH